MRKLFKVVLVVLVFAFFACAIDVTKSQAGHCTDGDGKPVSSTMC